MAHLFRIWHKLAPKYLLPNIKAVSDAHTNNTRGSTYNLSRELSRFSDGFAFTAIRQWNDLPNSIKSISGFQVFKRKLKDHLLSQYGWFLTGIFDRFIRSWNSFDSRSSEFLVACTRLYTPLCPSVGWSVGRSVGRSPFYFFYSFYSYQVILSQLSDFESN